MHQSQTIGNLSMWQFIMYQKVKEKGQHEGEENKTKVNNMKNIN